MRLSHLEPKPPSSLPSSSPLSSSPFPNPTFPSSSLLPLSPPSPELLSIEHLVHKSAQQLSEDVSSMFNDVASHYWGDGGHLDRFTGGFWFKRIYSHTARFRMVGSSDNHNNSNV
ncbi:hypothetical protein ONZ45_g13879 [Pleurotus djamor]|nr:hypothetical protein ONZ45_g13879 [Pleurotus djamor]